MILCAKFGWNLSRGFFWTVWMWQTENRQISIYIQKNYVIRIIGYFQSTEKLIWSVVWKSHFIFCLWRNSSNLLSMKNLILSDLYNTTVNTELKCTDLKFCVNVFNVCVEHGPLHTGDKLCIDTPHVLLLSPSMFTCRDWCCCLSWQGFLCKLYNPVKCIAIYFVL